MAIKHRIEAASPLSSIVSAIQLAKFLQTNYGFRPNAGQRNPTANSQTVDRVGGIPEKEWKRLVKDIKALGAKPKKSPKGLSREVYQLGQLLFNGGESIDDGIVDLLISSPNPKFDNTPYVGRPDE